jgi:hypothetical protein
VDGPSIESVTDARIDGGCFARFAASFNVSAHRAIGALARWCSELHIKRS